MVYLIFCKIAKSSRKCNKKPSRYDNCIYNEVEFTLVKGLNYSPSSPTNQSFLCFPPFLSFPFAYPIPSNPLPYLSLSLSLLLLLFLPLLLLHPLSPFPYPHRDSPSLLSPIPFPFPLPFQRVIRMPSPRGAPVISPQSAKTRYVFLYLRRLVE